MPDERDTDGDGDGVVDLSARRDDAARWREEAAPVPVPVDLPPVLARLVLRDAEAAGLDLRSHLSAEVAAFLEAYYADELQASTDQLSIFSEVRSLPRRPDGGGEGDA